jgi:ABC-type nitrate/sulfonate/bicarbonate transport system ATPase subunit
MAEPQAADPAIALHAVSFGFRPRRRGGARKEVLTNISLALDQGEFLALIGPSGCGKTTILNLMAGFLRPDRGTVTAGGRPVLGPTKEIGYVFQSPNLFPWLSVKSNIEFGPRLAGVPRAERTESGRYWLDRVGLTLSDYSQVYPHELSGGMAQRVALARALVNDPDALLMDEPFAALDALSRIQMQRMIGDLWQDLRKPAVLVTHSVDEAIALADRILLIGNGGIRGTWQVNLDRPRNSDAPEFIALRRELLDILLDPQRQGQAPKQLVAGQ